jgi:hypothetical protein
MKAPTQSVKLLCHLCGKSLPKVGYERRNGANHADWALRKYHKACWKKIE